RALECELSIEVRSLAEDGRDVVRHRGCSAAQLTRSSGRETPCKPVPYRCTSRQNREHHAALAALHPRTKRTGFTVTPAQRPWHPRHVGFCDWPLDRRRGSDGKRCGSPIRWARVSIIEDSGPQPLQDGDDRAEGQMALAACFSRARPILAA